MNNDTEGLTSGLRKTETVVGSESNHPDHLPIGIDKQIHIAALNAADSLFFKKIAYQFESFHAERRKTVAFCPRAKNQWLMKEIGIDQYFGGWKRLNIRRDTGGYS